ncbi:MAG: alpha/beta fold hydrolase [Reyranellaceae bacterium]
MGIQSEQPSVERRFRMDDGVELVAEAWGAPDHHLLLHSGGQTRHAWKGTAAVLASHGYHAIAVDLRGHGDSGWSADGNYEIDRFAADVAGWPRVFDQQPIPTGASLGGIASLIATGEAAQPIAAALVLP